MTWTREGFSKLGRPSFRSLIAGLRSQFENWVTLGALAWIALPSRCPPRAGLPRLGRLSVEVRLRNHFRASCRLDEFAGFLDAWVYREYDVPGLRWHELRTVVDVGANVGAATLWFASRAPKARIVAVEPSPAVIPSLVRNVEAAGLSQRVDVVPVALGATSGTGYLVPSPSSITATVGASRTGHPVPVVSLRQLLDQAGIDELDLLKLDCEGAELEILRSSETAVLPSVRVVVGEFHPTTRHKRDDLQEVLMRSGFDCQFIGGHDFGLFAAVRADRGRGTSAAISSEGAAHVPE